MLDVHLATSFIIIDMFAIKNIRHVGFLFSIFANQSYQEMIVKYILSLATLDKYTILKEKMITFKL